MTILMSFKFRKCFHLSVSLPVRRFNTNFQDTRRKKLSSAEGRHSSLGEVELGSCGFYFVQDLYITVVMMAGRRR